MNKMVFTHQFKAFDTEIELCLISEKKKFEDVVWKIERDARDFEKKFSRFDDASELNKINNKSSQEMKVSDEMLRVLLKAKESYRLTDGIFDPTICSVLSASGYDRSFGLLANGVMKENDMLIKNDRLKVDTDDGKKLSFEKFIISKKNKTIKLPVGLKIDLGGIAKGFWVDKMKDLLHKQFENYWISAGGDIFFKGKNEKNESWKVVVQNPLKLDEDLLYLNIPEQGYGVATSGITKRHGIKNGKKWNHLIDTRTNVRVKNSVLAVTVIARTATEADVMAKTVLILGVRKGLVFMHGRSNCDCVIIDKNLKMHVSSGIRKFL